MVQIFLKALGLSSINYAFVKIGETYYGALKYVDGLIRLGSKNYHILNKGQKISFLKHLFLNLCLMNSDIMGEIYLTKEGTIFSLDYGEAGVDIPLFNIDKRTEEEQSMLLSSFLKKTVFDYISRYILNYKRLVNEDNKNIPVERVDVTSDDEDLVDINSDEVTRRLIVIPRQFKILEIHVHQYKKILEDGTSTIIRPNNPCR